MEEQKNKIGVVVVNLNQLELTRKCIYDLQQQINKNFEIYLYDQNSKELGTHDFMLECSSLGINVIENEENIPLNYIWDNFKNICNCEYLCFLNNDTELSNKFIDDNINVFRVEPNVAFVIHVTNSPTYYITQNKLNYQILKPAYYQGWDFTIRRKLMPDIPKPLIIFGGDDYVFAKVIKGGYDVALVYSSPIIHHGSVTRATVANIGEIQNRDARYFYQVLAEEQLTQINITVNVGLCNRYPTPGIKIVQL